MPILFLILAVAAAACGFFVWGRADHGRDMHKRNQVFGAYYVTLACLVLSLTSWLFGG